MNKSFTLFLTLFIVLAFTCGTALAAEKRNTTSTQLPASSEAKDRAALENQKKQQKQAAEENARNAGSAGSGNVSPEQKKRQTGIKTKNQGQPTTGLPNTKD